MAQSADRSTYSLEGDLTLETVAQHFRELTESVTSADRRAFIDLAGIGRVDSAGLALLLEWQARACTGGGAVKIRNAPADLVKLAALCEAEALLGLDGAEATERQR